ncbi:MAG: Ku protein [Candidatus Pseudobacter hemicellulosilyticus]|uniref:Non-homologous end joining protein Ku n=1 Tax=Candidatus Pseudobacter hemicellulosilyticus TaxID=3121375 RepID=A0AAJ6BEQ9_9BACT|nr:MAG: Ku protein [Pseudobacter sp.]
MRAIWSGSIGFGLVNIPVKLYSAIQQSELDLDMLDKKDHANIKFQRVNAESGKVVPWANIVKAYNLDGRYVVLDDEDFQKAMPEKTKTIEILSFAEESEVDPMLFETPYYIEPDRSGSRAYSLLWSALRKSGKVGLGTFVLRTKETICLVKATDELLVLQRLRFEEEIRNPSDLNIPALTTRSTKPNELKMALSLIDQLTAPFDVSAYKDSYSDKLMKLIKAKARGKKVTTPHMKVVHSKAKDLMAQLKASLETKKKRAS